MKVAVSGKFDPVHNGHIEHIIKASKFGDYLVIITHIDSIVAETSLKGYCAVPLKARKLLLEGLLLVLKINGEVVVSIDEDGTTTETLRKLKPDILAKGGDRISTNMPENEVSACKEIGCEIVYGVGDLLNSSSSICKERK